MYSAELLENACADAWPPVHGDRIGQWRLRAADGFTGRANSVLAVGDPGMPVSRALERACEFAHAWSIRPMIQAVKDGPVETEAAAAGWKPFLAHRAGHEVSVLLGRPGTPGRADPELRMLAEPTPEWWRLTVGSSTPSPAQRHVLGTGRVGFGVLRREGATVGVVRAALAGDLVHAGRLAVAPEWRRRGLAGALMAAVTEWGGGRDCVLQVSVDNAPALAFYRRLGFSEHHRYRYWVPAESAWKDSFS